MVWAKPPPGRARSARRFNQLGAVNFHRRERAQFAGQFFRLEGEGFLGGLAPDQFRRQARDGNGRLAPEGLKRGAVNDPFAVLLLELDPHPQHLAAIRIADRAHGVGVGQLTQILRIGERRLDAGL